jgi:hypothetical protein
MRDLQSQLTVELTSTQHAMLQTDTSPVVRSTFFGRFATLQVTHKLASSTFKALSVGSNSTTHAACHSVSPLGVMQQRSLLVQQGDIHLSVHATEGSHAVPAILIRVR